jgi:peptidoglycan/xylan/chitin deacetylase (PgdA/CDA1 family)
MDRRRRFIHLVSGVLFLISIASGLRGQLLTSESEIPVLCYHNIKKQAAKITSYTISADNFESHIRELLQSGYKTVMPDDILLHLSGKKILSPKSVMISFDDTRTEHFHIAAPILEKHGFRGVFFIMTVSIGKPGYMTGEEIQKLFKAGHAVELHTYDHQDMRKLQGRDWDIQVDKASRTIENITGKKPLYLAYPFGAWNENVAGQVRMRGIKGAFQLTGKRHPNYKEYSIRRLLVPGQWNAARMMKEMRQIFKT